MATDTAYYYSNDTDVPPPAPSSLTRIMGCGSSPLAQYDGTGAYFLDRIADGVWRLELYPDVVWIDDPHAPTSLDREVSRLIWARRLLTLKLPDLGENFSARHVAPQASGVLRDANSGVGCKVPLWLDWHDVRIPFRQLHPLWSYDGGTV